MTLHDKNDWQTDFGIDEKKYPNFYSGPEDLNSAVPQAHNLRHAFNLLNLDGILCTENTPIMYFKLIDSSEPVDVFSFHQQFWNHGGAPVLVLISEDSVHVYSGMSLPHPDRGSQKTPDSLVATLDRVSSDLKRFLVSVETGNFFQQHSLSFNPDHRVDHNLLDNLKNARELLDDSTKQTVSAETLDALLCRLVFTCYLFDRGVIGEKYLNELGLNGKKHLRDVLAIRPFNHAKTALYKLFKQLGIDFNGDLFSDNLEIESRKITDRHIEILDDFFHGTNVQSGQIPFWPYDFRFIPIETISAIYEHFLKAEDQKKRSVLYAEISC